MEYLIGAIISLTTSVMVGLWCYKLSRLDSITLHRISQLDLVHLRIHQLDPKRWDSIRPGDGVKDTTHWMLCMAALMEETDFQEGHTTMKAIVSEMLAATPDSQTPSKLTTYDAGETKKIEWRKTLRGIRDNMPLTFLNRSLDIPRFLSRTK